MAKTFIKHLSTGKLKNAVQRTNLLEKNQKLISNATSKSPIFILNGIFFIKFTA